MNRPYAVAAVAATLTLAASLCHAQAPAPRDFAWRAPLEVPAGASLSRVSLPAQALVQLQSSDARDVRIFNAAGEAVGFALMAPSKPATVPVAVTRDYPALPLHSASSGAQRPKGAMQVRIDDPSGQRSIWVQMDGTTPAAAARLNSVLFATKDEQKTLSGLTVQGTLPANAPVWMSVSTSADLAQWTPVPVKSRLYRFEGDGSPVNTTLEFEQSTRIEGRYVRLDWGNQEGVTVSGITGVIATAARPTARVRADLPAPEPAATGAVEIKTGFLTPIAALALTTPRANSLLPIRVLGRNEPSQPWRLLARTVVYRLGSSASESLNPPVALNGASARWLRIEASNGADLAAARLHAVAEFDPVQLVFLATGDGPFQMAAGRPATASAALPIAMISSALGNRKVEDVPLVAVGSATLDVRGTSPWEKILPGVSSKSIVLWGVLLAGVLMLAAVAWTLLRQLKSHPPA